MFDKLGFYVRHSINDLIVNKQRTFFAILCIAAGVAAIVSLLTLSQMMTNTLTGSLQESNRGDIRITTQFAFGLDEATVNEGVEDGIITEVAAFSVPSITVAGVEHIRQWFEENYPGTIVTYMQAFTTNDFTGLNITNPAKDTDVQFVTPYVVEAEHYPPYGEIESEEGKPLAELLQNSSSIVISRNMADVLDSDVGDILRIAGSNQDYTITGIVATDEEAGLANILGALFGYYFVDASAAETFSALKAGEAANLMVKLGDPSLTDEAGAAFASEFPYLVVGTTTDLERQNTTFSNAIDDLVVVMGLVSLLIGGIGIVNTMLVIVSRRTIEIAVLKTLGLEPEQVTLLFLTQALLMGIIGSIAGVLLGWIMAFALQTIAERFVAQSLTFTITLRPALIGIIVGVVVTAIFGFLPTLAAGQVRPANVLRPAETMLPKAGRLQSFTAVVILVLAISVVVQTLMGDILSFDGLLLYLSLALGLFYGLIIAASTIAGGVIAMSENPRGQSWIPKIILWGVLLVILPAAVGFYAYHVPGLLVVTAAMIVIVYLYMILWLLIWAVGGGRPSELWPGILILAFPLFWPMIIPFIIIVIPGWILGWLIQRYTFIDLKIAMRSMLANKGRGATTLVALVIGVFTLSVITMMVETLNNAFERILEESTGGNVIVFAAATENTLTEVRSVMDSHSGVHSYALVGSHNVSLLEYQDCEAENKDACTAQTLNFDELKARAEEGETQFEARGIILEETLNGVDARELDSNLPNVRFLEGGNLSPNRDTEPDSDGVWPLVVGGNDAVIHAGIGLNDLLTFQVGDNESQQVTFRVVGVVDEGDGSISGAGQEIYAPIQAFGNRTPDSVFAVADVEEAQISDLRRTLSDIPGVFVIETRLINDLLNRIIGQFTSFPLLVAGLSLFTGGVVIANSVALSTLERRREIGIMKAVGLQRERVLGMLLLENGLMGFISGLIGVGMSFVGLLALLIVLLGNEFGQVIPYGTAFALMALCIIISLIAAMLTVWGASGEKPLNVLRYE